MHTTNTQKQKGIVLTEAIIAVGVMSIIFVSTLSLLSGSLGGVRDSVDRLIATYLAQDAVEYMQARWMYNKNSGAPTWDDGLQCGAGVTCSLDTTQGDVKENAEDLSPGCGTCMLDLDTNTGLYTPTSGGTASRFSRKITTASLNGGDELQVTITIGWTGSPADGSYETTFNIYKQ